MGEQVRVELTIDGDQYSLWQLGSDVDGAAIPGPHLGSDLDLELRGFQGAGLMHGLTASWALFSKCGTYRYALARFWDDYGFPGDCREWWDKGGTRPLLVFCMMNPSTAGAVDDDPTIRRCIRFAHREGCGGILVVNAFAYRATDPAELVAAMRRGVDIVGPDNRTIIDRALRRPLMAKAVAAWGRPHSARLERQSDALKWVRAQPWRIWWCLGLTKDRKYPRHPLMLSRNAELVRMAEA